MPDENPLLPLIRAALHGVDDPEIHRPITELGMVDDIHVADDGEVVVRILLTTGGCPLKDRLRNDVTIALSAVEGVTGVTVDMGVMNDGASPCAARAASQRDIPLAKLTSHTRVRHRVRQGRRRQVLRLGEPRAAWRTGRSVGLLDADVRAPDLLGLLRTRPDRAGGRQRPAPRRDPRHQGHQRRMMAVARPVVAARPDPRPGAHATVRRRVLGDLDY